MINLLIVDDEVQIREGIKNSIDWESHGIKVCGTASCAYEALELINQNLPDILITDIKMPAMDGLELVEIVNNKYPNIKVILISGYDDFEYTQKAIALKVFYYILKPIDDSQLLKKVQEAKQMIEDQYNRVKKDEELKTKYIDNIPILKDNFFNRLMNGKFSYFEAVADNSSFLGINFYFKKFAILIIEPEDDANGFERSSFDKSLFKIAIMNKTENLFSENLTCNTFNLSENIGVLIQGDYLSLDLIKSKCKDLKEWVNHTLNICATIAIGSTFEDILLSPVSYKECLEALKHKFILGRNSIIDIVSLCEANSTGTTSSSISLDLHSSDEELIYAFKTGNFEKARELLVGTVSELEKHVRNNIRNMDQFIFLLSYQLTKVLVALELFIDDFLSQEKNLYTQLKDINTLDEIKVFIDEFYNKIIEELKNNQNSQNSFLVNKAVDYINKNIYSDISLAKVADHLCIHPNYLSKIFKQNIGESFIEYLIKVKMNEAKKLLKNSNNKVYEIADILHYKDVSHFTKVFKSTFVISPTEYRNSLNL